MNIDIGTCISFGIDRIKQNPVYYIVGALILGAIQFVINMVANMLGFIWGFFVGLISAIIQLPELIMNFFAISGGMVIGILLGILIAPLFVGYIKGIKTECEGGKAEIGSIFSSFDILVPSIMNYGLAIIVMFVGFFMLIIPGIIVAPIAGITLFFLANGVTQGLDPLKKSFDVLKNNPIIILWNIVLGIVAAIGIIACGIGVIVTAPIAACAYYKMVRQATGEDNIPPNTPEQKIL